MLGMMGEYCPKHMYVAHRQLSALGAGLHFMVNICSCRYWRFLPIIADYTDMWGVRYEERSVGSLESFVGSMEEPLEYLLRLTVSVPPRCSASRLSI